MVVLRQEGWEAAGRWLWPVEGGWEFRDDRPGGFRWRVRQGWWWWWSVGWVRVGVWQRGVRASEEYRWADRARWREVVAVEEGEEEVQEEGQVQGQRHGCWLL